VAPRAVESVLESVVRRVFMVRGLPSPSWRDPAGNGGNPGRNIDGGIDAAGIARPVLA